MIRGRAGRRDRDGDSDMRQASHHARARDEAFPIPGNPRLESLIDELSKARRAVLAPVLESLLTGGARALTDPAPEESCPPYRSSFSVSVVLPASGWEMMAKVRRLAASRRA